MNNHLVAEMQVHKWAMEEVALKAFFERLVGINSAATLPTAGAKRDNKLLVTAGIATINISGVLLKTVPEWLRRWGIEATGYDEIRYQIDAAVKDNSVKGIRLNVSSPGGVVDGVADTADAIFAARSEKPVNAYIEDLGASAAYWLTSQAQDIRTNRTAEVGSIGVYTVYTDWSKWEEDKGIKVIVIRSGEHKGMGIDKITDSQIEAVQETIDSLAGSFIDAVAAGRGMAKKEIKKLATGRLWIADEAEKLGLIDGITKFQTVSKSKVKEINMDPKDEKAQEQVDVKQIAADAVTAERSRMTELKAAFPKDPAFAIEQFEAGADVKTAKAAYCDVLAAKLKEQEEAAALQKPATGAEAIASGDSDTESGEDFMTEARKLFDDGKVKTLTAAMQRVARTRPELHEAFKARCKTTGKAIYNEL